MRVVLDTNVVISAALSPDGTPGQIINLIANNETLQVCYGEKILAEYE